MRSFHFHITHGTKEKELEPKRNVDLHQFSRADQIQLNQEWFQIFTETDIFVHEVEFLNESVSIRLVFKNRLKFYFFSTAIIEVSEVQYGITEPLWPIGSCHGFVGLSCVDSLIHRPPSPSSRTSYGPFSWICDALGRLIRATIRSFKTSLRNSFLGVTAEYVFLHAVRKNLLEWSSKMSRAVPFPLLPIPFLQGLHMLCISNAYIRKRHLGCMTAGYRI